MNDYTVEHAEVAKKELLRLPAQIIRRIVAAIDALADDPRPHGCVKLKGSASTYRIRVGNYRIVYDIDDACRLVLITRVRHRKDVYD